MRRSVSLVRGFYVISSLMISVIVALFVTAALKLSVGNLQASNGRDMAALYAADSGLRYVQARLASDYSWVADNGLVVNSSNLVVREERGNIVGIIRAPDGQFAQFRVRFNYQDDAQGDRDGLSDPVALWVDSPYVSLRNFSGGTSVPLPRADGPNFSVTPTSETPYEVSAATSCIIVEGRAGPGLGQLSATNLNPPVKGAVTTRVVEACFEGGAYPGANSTAQSAGDMTFTLQGTGEVTLGAKDSNQLSRLKSRSTIEVTGGGSPNLVSDNAETYTPDGSLAADASANVTPQTDLNPDDFFKLEWDDVKKAGSSDATLAAGTYVVWDDGTLHYYDMSYDSYVTFIEGAPSHPGTLVDASSLPSGVSFNGDPSNPKIVIDRNLYIDDSSSSTDEFNLIPRAGAQEDPPNSSDGDATALAQTVSGNLGTGNNQPHENNSLPGATKYYLPSGAIGGSENIVVPSGPSVQGFEIVKHGNHFHILKQGASGSIVTPSDFANLLGQSNLSPSQQASVVSFLTNLNGGVGVSGGMEEIEVGTEPATLRPDDVVIEFDPPDGQSAILSAKGTIRLGMNVRGEGGSITSEGSIKIIGNGTELAASLEDGLTLYAKKDVVLSSLKESPVGSNNWIYKDVKLKGVVYAWGNIEAKLSSDDPDVSQHGTFSLDGALVAYGGNPADAPGSGTGGEIAISSKQTELTYDPAYLQLLSNAPPPGPVKQILYTTY